MKITFNENGIIMKYYQALGFDWCLDAINASRRVVSIPDLSENELREYVNIILQRGKCTECGGLLYSRGKTKNASFPRLRCAQCGLYNQEAQRPHVTAQRIALVLSKYYDGESLLAISEDLELSIGQIRHVITTYGQTGVRTVSGHRKGDKHPNAKVTDDEIAEIRSMWESGFPVREISEKHNLSKGYVYKIVKNIYRK